MRSSVFRTLLTAFILVLLLAPEAMLLHQCPCGKILSCCCRMQAKMGASCQMHHGARPCAGASEGTPASLQSPREPLDRPGISLAAFRAIHLTLAGQAPEAPAIAVAWRVFDPPVPPPRLPQAA